MDLTWADEGRHPPGPGPAWEESWDFDWATADGRLGGYVRLALRPADGVAWYWAAVAGEGRPPVLVADDTVRLPPGRSLEVRAEALWGDHVCETPADHWSVGAEAFAVALDDPSEAWGAARGDRVPFGLDLEWEAEDRPRALPGAGYEVPCLVTGVAIVGDERVEVEAWGWRRHAWGNVDWGSPAPPAVAGRMADGTWVSAPLDGGPVANATPMVGGRAGDVAVEPVALAGILVTLPRVPAVRVAREVCRLRRDDGVDGGGWAERVVAIPSDDA